jgi:hypothetical protein
MTADRIEAIRGLLAQAEAAHGVYEQAELGGVYDQDWPRWYATFAVDHGMAGLLGRPVTADELARFLERSWQERQSSGGDTSSDWAQATARQIATEL